jgi:hypothetical protein
MVMNTRSGSQANRRRRSNPNPKVQNNPQPLLFPPPGGGDQDCIAMLEAQMEAMTR